MGLMGKVEMATLRRYVQIARQLIRHYGGETLKGSRFVRSFAILVFFSSDRTNDYVS